MKRRTGGVHIPSKACEELFFTPTDEVTYSAFLRLWSHVIPEEDRAELLAEIGMVATDASIAG